jgi:hypothetical protein
MAGSVLLVASVAWGRAGLSNKAGFAPRYATLMAPLGCWFYLLWGRYGNQKSAAVVQTLLFALVCVFAAHNFQIGINQGRKSHARLESLEDDIGARLPLEEVADHHVGKVFGHKESLILYLKQLQSAQFGPFAAESERPDTVNR